jgi:2-oxo-4-hydroxy-4-carboxy-5-ureidoimidazoline decarboxylase
MAAGFPFEKEEDLYKEAELIWYDCAEEDWKEAFSYHPKIGDLEWLSDKSAATSQWVEGEMAGVKYTTPQVLAALAAINTEYEEKFGYIFVVSASGMSAEEMLSMLTLRLLNSPEDEITIAMEEQHKITLLRLSKLLS